MKTEPQAEHHWLQKLVGEWTYETPSADKPSETWKGTESVRSLDGIWFLAEGQGDMPGGDTARMVMTLGYDVLRKRYVGTWIGSMLAYLWVYDGELSSDGRELVLSAEGPSMAGDGSMAKYQDVITFLSDDHRTLTARTPGEDGEWRPFMTVHYRRA